MPKPKINIDAVKHTKELARIFENAKRGKRSLISPEAALLARYMILEMPRALGPGKIVTLVPKHRKKRL